MTQRSTTRFISSVHAHKDAERPAVYLRREFDMAETPRRAVLRITGLGIVEPHLNGAVVGDEVLAPGWTSYRHRLVVSTHDVTDDLVVGRNAIGAVLGEGWAVGRLGWENERNHYSDRPALYLELAIEYEDRTETVSSDLAFRAGTGGVRKNGIYDGVDFDARLEPDGWDRPGFDDSRWEEVEFFDWPPEALTEPFGEPIRRVEELRPVEILTTPSGRTVVDFGQILSGWVRLTVEGEAGTTITLRHAEVMTDGEIDVETLRSAKATDRYTLRGGAPETWEPRFTFHGFRYVEVEGWPGELGPECLRAVVVHSDMRRTGWLETSDPLLDRLHANAVWSMRGNFVGLPTDCPQRDERLGWTGDINAFAPAAAFLYDVRGVLGSWLRDLAAEQAAKGFVPWVVPDVFSHPSSPTALWSDVAVSLPWTLYREYGDEAILEDSYDSMCSFIRKVAELVGERGLWDTGFQFGDWLDPDAPMDDPAGGRTDAHLVAAAYLCRTTREMAETARVLARADDAAEFSALAERVREAFLAEYVSPNGRVMNESATAYALAIVFDILDAEQKRHAGDRLAALVAENGYRISTGFAGTPHVTDALTATGHLDAAYLLLSEKTCPSFLYPVTMGATTIWERWDSVRPDGSINPSGMTSLNHYAFGAVVDWMHRTIGGLSPIEPGYRRMRIAPRPGGGLTHATLRHHTVHGEVRVAWRITDGTFTLEVQIPEGTVAEVTLPSTAEATTVEAGPGSHQWTCASPGGASGGRVFDLDSPLRDIADVPRAWELFAEAFAVHIPDAPLDDIDSLAPGISVRTLLDFVPDAAGKLRSDLIEALRLASKEGSA